MLRAEEAIEVSVNQAGEPIGFRWRNERYQVASRPIRWYSRRDWWVEAPRAYRGIGAGVMELEMWRLTANCGPGTLQFELIHGQVGNTWKLLRVYE
ncbi:MAG: hypothetical protein RL530_201 [Actinomycetota bacterium]